MWRLLEPSPKATLLRPVNAVVFKLTASKIEMRLYKNVCRNMIALVVLTVVCMVRCLP